MQKKSYKIDLDKASDLKSIYEVKLSACDIKKLFDEEDVLRHEDNSIEAKFSFSKLNKEIVKSDNIDAKFSLGLNKFDYLLLDLKLNLSLRCQRDFKIFFWQANLKSEFIFNSDFKATEQFLLNYESLAQDKLYLLKRFDIVDFQEILDTDYFLIEEVILAKPLYNSKNIIETKNKKDEKVASNTFKPFSNLNNLFKN